MPIARAGFGLGDEIGLAHNLRAERLADFRRQRIEIASYDRLLLYAYSRFRNIFVNSDDGVDWTTVGW